MKPGLQAVVSEGAVCFFREEFFVPNSSFCPCKLSLLRRQKGKAVDFFKP